MCWRSTRCLAKIGLWAGVALCVCASAESHRPALITSLKVEVLPEKIEVRIQADREFSMQTTILTHPDRIVLDAAGALFKVRRPEIQGNTGPVRSVRIGLLQTEPPVTRIIIDSSSAVPYSFRMERNSAFLDILLQPDPATPVGTAETPPVAPKVTYDHGMLAIAADNSTLAEILDAIHSRIGGTTEFPAAAANERATVHLGPAPLVSVLADLLLGSPFDYVIVGSGKEPGGIQILLSERSVYPERQGRPTEALALVSPEETALVNYASEAPPPASESAGPQPDDGARMVINQPPVGLSGSEDLSSQNGDLPSDTPPSPPQNARPSREGPRILPPGKGH
jgi:hypothetical protein